MFQVATTRGRLQRLWPGCRSERQHCDLPMVGGKAFDVLGIAACDERALNTRT